MKKKVLLFIAVLSLFICTACGADKNSKKKQDSVQRNDSENNGDSSDTSDSYPMTLVDQSGREVVINSKPTRLVSSYYITTSALLALDLKDEIKGVESKPEKRNLYNLCATELFEVTQVGSPKEFDIEACASIEPDLVILPLRAKDMVEPLEKLGITVLVVNPESQDDILAMIELIGRATDRIERAKELTDYIQSKIDFLSEKMVGVDNPSVYLGGNSSFFSTASKGMYQNNQITLAGGKNVAGDIDDTYWVEVSYEQILEWNPEYIVLAAEASYPLEDIKNDANLSYCQAIANDNVFNIPSDIEAFDSPVPSSFLGAVYLSSVLHPDIITSELYEDMVEEYYEKFYGFSYSQK